MFSTGGFEQIMQSANNENDHKFCQNKEILTLGREIALVENGSTIKEEVAFLFTWREWGRIAVKFSTILTLF